ncbi:c-type cytochrome [Thiobacillus sp. 65-1402]|uniref:c-type cytochrome n=1 Tax=Thiobacillus sp. 65-1402 TaxID=1895861 RepID=UPI0009641C53|nr:c-type cytochrome [Thiobacillus sp. 65-1402]OJW99913.1 MAG: cytochrome C [Thiobacillus sp. 65-1402]
MKTTLKIAGALLAGWAGLAGAQPPAGDADIRHGRYLIQISGCNDCHTTGYTQKSGQVPEAEWLTGDAMGWQGPWGTTYATNLRLLFQQMDEQAWLARARQPMRPPMPSPSLRAMSDADLKAIYRYVRSLGVKGSPAPAYVSPGGKVATPYFDFTPKNLPPMASQR